MYRISAIPQLRALVPQSFSNSLSGIYDYMAASQQRRPLRKMFKVGALCAGDE
jgi:hypothetical protein